MSGLTARNQAGQSGLVAAKVDFQRFTGSATYTKPGDVSIIWIECIGAGGGGGGGGNLMGNYAAPTGNFQSGVSIAQQVDKNNIFAKAVKAAMTLSPTRMAMSLLARVGDLTPTMSFMADDPRAINAPITTAGIPGYLGQNYGVGTITDVAMAGSGAHMAPATAIENWGGKNVHVGPGYPMDENFYPGFGVNPYSGVAMADPSDPYIRKRRGTEIAGMI